MGDTPPLFSEMLRAKRASPGAILHSFRLRCGSPNLIHVFVEGYDDLAFYSKVLTRRLENSRFTAAKYVCFGKKNMHLILTALDATDLPKDRVLFIRDSDFDQFLNRIPPNPLMFVTDGYSVENYVFSSGSLFRCLEAQLGVAPDQVGLTDVCLSFERYVNRLFEALASFFGACLSATRKGRQLDLDRFPIDQAIKRVLDSKSDVDLTGMISQSAQAVGLEEDDFTASALEDGAKYTSQSAMQWLRGKYLARCAWWLVQRERERMRSLYKSGKILYFNRAAAAKISMDSLFTLIYPFAECPLPLAQAFASIASELSI